MKVKEFKEKYNKNFTKTKEFTLLGKKVVLGLSSYPSSTKFGMDPFQSDESFYITTYFLNFRWPSTFGNEHVALHRIRTIDLPLNHELKWMEYDDEADSFEFHDEAYGDNSLRLTLPRKEANKLFYEYYKGVLEHADIEGLENTSELEKELELLKKEIE